MSDKKDAQKIKLRSAEESLAAAQALLERSGK